MPFISFEDVEQLATIEQLADRLGLHAKPSGRQLRCTCPVHGGDDRTLAITPDVKSKRGSDGVFFCQKSKTGGDRIGLVAHCMDIGQQDAAFFIAEQFGTGTVNSTSHSTGNALTVPKSTVPQKPEGRTEKSQPAPSAVFDPVKFAAKLVFTDEVAALGYTESDAKLFGIGMYRGHVYKAARYQSGCTAGFWKYEGGKWTAPKQWLPDTSNVVKLRA
jgi:hypothetical protein